MHGISTSHAELHLVFSFELPKSEKSIGDSDSSQDQLCFDAFSMLFRWVESKENEATIGTLTFPFPVHSSIVNMYTIVVVVVVVDVDIVTAVVALHCAGWYLPV